MITEALKTIVAGGHLSEQEASDLLDYIVDHKPSDIQIAALLTALAVRGETVDELTGFARVMRQRAASFTTRHQIYVDTAGTGGDGQGSFNISTTAAFVIAGAGVAVAKHGNRSVSSRSGSADILERLGVRVVLSAAAAGRCLDEIGICFMFAPAFHPAMLRVAEIRKKLGIRTAFNLLGPLTNPANTPRQVVGVYAESLLEKCAGVLSRLGTERAWVVWGHDGLDELSLSAPTSVAEVSSGYVRYFEVSPEDFGLERAPAEAVQGGDPQENAATLRRLLSGAERGPLRSIVLMNAAAALYVASAAPSLKEATRLAAESIDSGRATERLERLIEVSSGHHSAELAAK